MRELINLDELRLTMRAALVSVSEGLTKNMPRQVSSLHSTNVLGIMPAFSPSLKIAGYKAVTVFPENNKHRLNPHQGLMILLNYQTGEILCTMDGMTITALRTAAVSAIAADILSNPDAETLAIIGAGLQARENILALSRVRSFKRIKIYNRTKENTQKLIEEFSKLSDISFSIETNAVSAIKDSDVVVTCTSSAKPLFKTSDLSPGTHVNALGACRPGFREIDINPQDNLKVFLDNRLACRNEAQELFHLRSDFDELGFIINGRGKGRTNHQDITLFKSVGIGALDLFAADLTYKKALC